MSRQRILSEPQREKVRSLIESGVTHRRTAEIIGCSLGCIHRTIYPKPGSSRRNVAVSRDLKPTPEEHRAHWAAVAAQNEREASHG